MHVIRVIDTSSQLGVLTKIIDSNLKKNVKLLRTTSNRRFINIYIRNIRRELSSFLYTESIESGYWNPVGRSDEHE